MAIKAPRNSPERSAPTEGRHWQFALATYAEEGVAAACIDLQERYGVDVILLLIAGFAALSGTNLQDEDLTLLEEEARAWREEVVLPLRRVRRALKLDPLPALSGAVRELRAAVQAAEITSEQLELAVLAAALPAVDQGGGGPPDRLAPILDRIIARAARQRDVPLGPDVQPSLRRIAAAMRVAGS